MFTKIDICNMALLKLGEKPITSFDEDSAAATLARTLFDTTSDAILASHTWRFATKKYELARTDDGRFIVPNDALRIISCDLPHYEITDGAISAPGRDHVNLTAIYRTATENYPSYFANVLAIKMAMEFCMPLSSDQNMLGILATLLDSELRTAKFIDSTMASPSAISEFSLLSARY